MTVTLPPPILPAHPACSIDGCTRPAQGRSGWCHTHYEHNRRYGRPQPLTVDHPRWGQSGPPPLPKGRVWAAARRRRHALAALANVTAPRSTA